jgi:hypothetical protein
MSLKASAKRTSMIGEAIHPAAPPLAPDIAAGAPPVACFQCNQRGGSPHDSGVIPSEIVTIMVVKGLIERDAGGHLALSDRGRAVLPDF